MKILDLFCGGGGASHGYVLAGHDVVGIDKYPQPEYPYKFVQLDWRIAIEKYSSQADIIHASPVCKGYSTMVLRDGIVSRHAREIADVREACEATGKPYVIENIPDARNDMKIPVQMCGSYFKLRVRRHRLFESNLPIVGTPCAHEWQDDDQIYIRIGRYSVPNFSGVCPVYGHVGQLFDDDLRIMNKDKELKLMQQAMGIDWMSRIPLTQAIPPTYTEHIGKQFTDLIG